MGLRQPLPSHAISGDERRGRQSYRVCDNVQNYLLTKWNFQPVRTLCESAATTSDHQARPLLHQLPQHYPEQIADNNQILNRRQHYQQIEESCPSCLYTGVATCFGLASYFTYLALEDELYPKQQAAVATKHLTIQESGAILRRAAHNKPGFLLVAAGWVAIGMHRWSLG
jgi:hypothetical protein